MTVSELRTSLRFGERRHNDGIALGEAGSVAGVTDIPSVIGSLQAGKATGTGVMRSWKNVDVSCTTFDEPSSPYAT